MKKALTVKLIDNLVCLRARRVEVRDTLLPGFGMRVSPNGRKAWFAVGRVSGKQVRHTIGTYPTVQLTEARQAARTVLSKMQLGTYVGEPVSKLTFKQAREMFIERYAKPRNRDWARTESVLRKFAEFDNVPLEDVRRAQVARTLDTIVAGGAPIRANRALAAVKKLFAWALDRGLIDVHPVVGLKPVAKEVRRDRILNDAELRQLLIATSKLGYPFGIAIQLFLLTGQRRGEVTRMRWSDIDLEHRIWTIPAYIAKNDRVHEVPLSEQVISILQSVPVFVGSDLVFTTTGVTPISGFGRIKERLDKTMGVGGWRFHDLRRTAASGMARLGIAPHVIEKVLNHQSGQISGVAAIYNRHGYEKEKRHALKTWGAQVGDIGRKLISHSRHPGLENADAGHLLSRQASLPRPVHVRRYVWPEQDTQA